MVVDCLLKSGLSEFQISVGHADFFRGLLEAAGTDEEEEQELKSLISNKNFFGVEEFAETLKLDPGLTELFHMLGNPNVGKDDLQKAGELAASYPRILAAVRNLIELQKILEIYGLNKYVSFELGIISSYQYYTGIIFSGYTFGSGQPIVKGGRYDRLLTYYGKDSASIGFAIVVDQLMAALSRQKIDVTADEESELIVYDSDHRKEAILTAKEKRSQGKITELIAENGTKTRKDYMDYARRNRIGSVTFLED